jgi:hypothetical protein
LKPPWIRPAVCIVLRASSMMSVQKNCASAPISIRSKLRAIRIF